MGRKIRRVPLDFNWPLKHPWDGPPASSKGTGRS